MAKILVAMSGGVDSTIAAYKLQQSGHSVEGCYMRLYDNENSHKENIKKVEKVAKFLGIKYHILDLKEEFEKLVYKPFIQTYKNGRTPNPCVVCNRNIKFGSLIEFAKNLGINQVATGHYVQIKNGFISEAVDKTKDQSYFLANIKKESIPLLVFPLGELHKEDIKKFANTIPELQEFASQKESSEICFVESTYVDTLKEHTSVDMEGDVLNTEGEVIGKHQGYMHYTIGKRRGFEVRGAHEPHYVTNINPETNTITVGTKEALKKDSFKVENLNLFIDESDFESEVKIRYRSPKVKCKVQTTKTGAQITLYESIYGIAPGQRAVFYLGEQVVGSGEII